jgi:hypothetical protein
MNWHPTRFQLLSESLKTFRFFLCVCESEGSTKMQVGSGDFRKIRRCIWGRYLGAEFDVLRWSEAAC